ncbi:hypothetical protein CIPAW_04G172500 [Carya illinoinensis]|uniref:Uncharacterized protein n=1 Tax=Carya illinoinensis TaxID=32201 RepID=A0A8T1QWR9_CARIL|nr:hypothetical protein CIPAW_04G172500 [Carya illinoinensis]
MSKRGKRKENGRNNVLHAQLCQWNVFSPPQKRKNSHAYKKLASASLYRKESIYKPSSDADDQRKRGNNTKKVPARVLPNNKKFRGLSPENWVVSSWRWSLGFLWSAARKTGRGNYVKESDQCM